jgi:protein-S-isoprenylcysteine O-methyltransferase Ste14
MTAMGEPRVVMSTALLPEIILQERRAPVPPALSTLVAAGIGRDQMTATLWGERANDLFARLVVATLFALLSINLWSDFARTHRLTGLLLLVGEALVAVLTLVRRRTGTVDRSLAARVVTLLSVMGPLLLRTGAGPGLFSDRLTALVSAAGLVVVIAGKLTLGRSFGIAPANRGVVIAGPYTLVRHPIYAGYLLSHVAFACAYPTVWNIAALAVTDVALVLRALCEERVLAADQTYQSYCRRVAWHLIPGVF